jgi:hypothetical protein
MPARIPSDSFSESTRQAPSNGGNRHVISWVFLIRRAQGRKKDASRSRQDRKIRFQQDLKSHFGLDMIAPTSPQYCSVVRIEDYGLKEGTMQDQREPDLSVIGCMDRLRIALAVT